MAKFHLTEFFLGLGIGIASFQITSRRIGKLRKAAKAMFHPYRPRSQLEIYMNNPAFRDWARRLDARAKKHGPQNG